MNKEVVFHTCRICQSTAYNQVRMCKGASSDFYFWQKDFISSIIKFCVEFSGNNLQDPTGLQGLSHGYQEDKGMVQTLLRFSWSPILPCNGRDRSSTASHLICQFSDGDTTILHHNSPQLLNDNLILGCWGLIRTCFTLQWCASAWKQLDHADQFHLSITKLYTKFDTVSLFRFFLHFVKNENPMTLHYTSLLVGSLPSTDNLCRWEKFLHAH